VAQLERLSEDNRRAMLDGNKGVHFVASFAAVRRAARSTTGTVGRSGNGFHAASSRSRQGDGKGAKASGLFSLTAVKTAFRIILGNRRAKVSNSARLAVSRRRRALAKRLRA